MHTAISFIVYFILKGKSFTQFFPGRQELQDYFFYRKRIDFDENGNEKYDTESLSCILPHLLIMQVCDELGIHHGCYLFQLSFATGDDKSRNISIQRQLMGHNQWQISFIH